MMSLLAQGGALLLLRTRPQDLPYDPRGLGVLLILNVLLSLAVQQISDPAMTKPVWQLSLLGLGLDGLWLGLLLWRRQWQARWVQAFSALVVLEFWVTALAAPIALMAGIEALLPAVMALQTVLAFWSVWVRATVYAQTLETGRGFGLLMALTPLVLLMLVALQLFPELLQEAAAAAASAEAR